MPGKMRRLSLRAKSPQAMLALTLSILLQPARCAQSQPSVKLSPGSTCIQSTSAEGFNLRCRPYELVLQGGSYQWGGPAVGTERAEIVNGSEFEYSMLRVRPARVEDNGTYSCTFIPAAGNGAGQSFNDSVLVRVIEPGRFLSPSNHTTDHQVITMGTEGVIRCPNASLGNPQVDIYWQKEPGNTHLREGNEIAFRDGRRELVIHDVTASHAGRYICILGNAECQSTPAYPANRSITVSVQGLAPSLNRSANHSTVTVLFNGSLTLTCDPLAGTQPIYHSWRQPGTSEVIQNTRLQLTPSSLLTGDYTCVVSNQWGEASLVTHVTVQAPPVLPHKLVYETASTGHSLTIKCDLDKESPTPNPTPCWSWDIHVLTANSTLKNIMNQTLPRISISSSGKALVIDPVTEEDYSTEFVCVVQNTIAKDNQTTRLLHQEGLSLCMLSSEGHSRHQLAEKLRSYISNTHSCSSRDNCLVNVTILSVVPEGDGRKKLVGVVESSLPGVVEQLNSSLAGGHTISLGGDSNIALDCEGDGATQSHNVIRVHVLVAEVGAVVVVVTIIVACTLLTAVLCYRNRRGHTTGSDAERGPTHGYTNASLHTPPSSASSSSSSLESNVDSPPASSLPCPPSGDHLAPRTNSGHQ